MIEIAVFKCFYDKIGSGKLLLFTFPFQRSLDRVGARLTLCRLVLCVVINSNRDEPKISGHFSIFF
jgi:hypothetical protein